ncbi:hypothetical protein GQ457_15G024700 [Hibiscus cannabinus]
MYPKPKDLGPHQLQFTGPESIWVNCEMGQQFLAGSFLCWAGSGERGAGHQAESDLHHSPSDRNENEICCSPRRYASTDRWDPPSESPVAGDCQGRMGVSMAVLGCHRVRQRRARSGDHGCCWCAGKRPPGAGR